MVLCSVDSKTISCAILGRRYNFLMKIHWLIKYYFIGFTAIFLIVYNIENSEPYINWSLYPEISETKVMNMIINKECDQLVKLYKNEYDENYKKNSLGFIIRKEKKFKNVKQLRKQIKSDLLIAKNT